MKLKNILCSQLEACWLLKYSSPDLEMETGAEIAPPQPKSCIRVRMDTLYNPGKDYGAAPVFLPVLQRLAGPVPATRSVCHSDASHHSQGDLNPRRFAFFLVAHPKVRVIV